TALVAVAAIVIGILLGKAIFSKNTQQKIDEANQQANKIIEDAKISAETLKEKKLLEAKEKFLALKTQNEKEELQRTKKLQEVENKLRQKEQSLNDKNAQLTKQINENAQLKA